MPLTRKAQKGHMEPSLAVDTSSVAFHAPWDVLSEEHLDFPSLFPFAQATWMKAAQQMLRWEEPRQHELRF